MEDIEFDDLGDREEEPRDEDYEEETSFIEWDSSYLQDFGDNEEMLNAFRRVDEKLKVKTDIRKVVKDSINYLSLTDKLDEPNWVEDIQLSDTLNDQEWKDAVDHFNNDISYIDNDITINPNSVKSFNFFENFISSTKTPKTEETNGYTYKGRKTIKRSGFIGRYNFVPESENSLKNFVRDYKREVLTSARDNLVSETKIIDRDMKVVARYYIYEAREEQKSIIENTVTKEGLKKISRKSTR